MLIHFMCCECWESTYKIELDKYSVEELNDEEWMSLLEESSKGITDDQN